MNWKCISQVLCKTTAAKYILSQEEHHKKKPFKEEYFEMLDQNCVQFKEEYLFEFFDDIHDWD
jgi:putative transposase